MSKLDELIKQLCPNGVKYRAIGELITRSREKAKDYHNITTVYAVSNTQGVVCSSEYRENEIHSEDTSNYLVVKPQMFVYNPARLNIGSIAYLQSDTGLVSPMYVVFSVNNNLILNEYLFTIIRTPKIMSKICSMVETGARFRFDFSRWNNVLIPVPPVIVQKEIMSYLNKFKEHSAELTAELTARKKQYEYYRDKTIKACKSPKYYKLEEVANIYDGTHATPKYVSNGIPFISVENINNIYGSTKYITREAFSKYKVKPQIDDVFMTRIGSIGTCAIFDKQEDIAYYVSLALIRPNTNVVLSKYLKYIIESSIGRKELYKRTLINAVPIKINKGDIGKLNLPIPSINEQERIVSILDRFDKLCNDISEGLPAEIEARKKQYEYYRDKLLTFKEVS